MSARRKMGERKAYGRRKEDVLPPKDPEAERNLLGTLLVDGSDAFVTAQKHVKDDRDFYDPLNGDIYRKIADAHASGERWDEGSIRSRLEKDGPLTGPQLAILMGLRDGVHHGAPVAYYAKVVADKARLRRMGEAGNQLFRVCFNGAEPEEREAIVARIVEEASSPGDAGRGVELVRLRYGDYRLDVPPPVAFGDAATDTPLAVGDLVVFAADSGSGKSLSILDLALAWCTLKPWLGFAPTGAAGGALIISSDGDGADPVRARVVRLGLGRGLDGAALDALDLYVVPVDGFNLDSPACFAALRKLLADVDPGLLALETISSLMGPERDPYNQGSVADFVARRLRPLQTRPDGSRRTMVVSHHLRKRRGEPGANALRDRVVGSYYLVAGVDSLLGFEPTGPEAFNVRLVKPSRWGLRMRAFHVEIEGKPPGPLTLRSSGPLEQSSTERSADEGRFLDALAGAGPDGWSSLSDVKRRAGVDPKDKRLAKRFERAAKRLAEAEVIEAHAKGRGRYRMARKPGEDTPPEDLE